MCIRKLRTRSSYSSLQSICDRNADKEGEKILTAGPREDKIHPTTPIRFLLIRSAADRAISRGIPDPRISISWDHK